MKTKNLMTITTVALGTAALTVMTFWSSPLEAGAEADAFGTKVPKAKLVSHGVEMTLATAGGQTFKAGDEPAFVLTAVNPTAAPAAVTVRLAMTATSPTDKMSRVPRLPTALWQQHETLTLKPHETRAVAISTSKKLPAKSMIGVSLQESSPSVTNAMGVAAQVLPEVQQAAAYGAYQSGIVALNFSTAAPVAQTASAK